MFWVGKGWKLHPECRLPKNTRRLFTQHRQVEHRSSRLYLSRAKTADNDIQEQQISPTTEVQIVEINGIKRRVITLDKRQVQHSTPTKVATDNGSKENVTSSPLDANLVEFVKGFVLPKGYPKTCSSDYLEYQLRVLPAHITGWMSRSLATSSLIQALNIGTNASTTVAAGAAIKWITKDGIGALGRFLVGGRLAGVFDEDPRRWRIIAVGFATLGLAFEIATTAFPANFIILAGAGNFSKALGKGLSQPSFRIIQTHFAQANNVGDISAKEEVWEVTAQLLGLAASVSVLRGIETSGNPNSVLWIWGFIQVVHVSLRYFALKSLVFTELNQKRASMLIEAYISGKEIPNPRLACQQEPIFADTAGVGPCIQFGVSVETAFGGRLPSSKEMQDLIGVYGSKKSMLIWREARGYGLLADNHGPEDIIRLLFQGALLKSKGVTDASTQDYKLSLQEVDKDWPTLIPKIEAAGWNFEHNVFRLGDTRIQLQPKQASAV